MNVRGFLAGAAAALAIASAAQATDAVVADQPSLLGPDTVNACDAYGTGFVVVPGTGTCVRVGGQLRYEQRFSDTGRASHGRTTLDIETRGDPW